MSNQTEHPPLRPGDRVRFIHDSDHVETVESCEWIAAPTMLSAARRESLRICGQALARRNPELFEKLNAEFETMTDAEIAVIAGWPHRWRVVTNWPGNRRVADAAEFLIAGNINPNLSPTTTGSATTLPKMGVTHELTAAEARFLETRDRILARRNPELLERENAEFEAMTDAELLALARPAAPQPPIREGRAMGADGFDEIGSHSPIDTAPIVTEAGMGLENPAELWRRYEQAFALFDALTEPDEEDEATFCAVVREIEKIATDQVPVASLEGVLFRLRLIQHRQETIAWGELEDELIARAIEGLEAMGPGGG